MKVVCISNIPRIFKDNSSDDANKYLTVGKVYEATYVDNQSLSPGGNSDMIFIEVSDKGGFPHGHRWWDKSRFQSLDDVRQIKLNRLGI